MNAEERQVLREQHGWNIDSEFGPFCASCCAGDEYPSIAYPCDVIKMLDAIERVGETNPKLLGMGMFASLANNETEVECDYFLHNDEAVPADHYYCPKCGVKL